MSDVVTVSPAMRDALCAIAQNGWIRFDDFMRVALFAPEIGYYAQKRRRVGRTAEADFFTATSSGTVFGELVCSAAKTLLGAGARPRDYTLVEIGAETERGVIEGVENPFGAHRVLRLGDALEISGRCVVFSNELFDAQPCRSFVRRGGAWCDRGVRLRADGGLEWSERVTEGDESMPVALRELEAREGYVLDLPLDAVSLVGRLAAQPWSGLFIACDYGKSWAELSAHTPQGTLRAYRRQRQSGELLAHVGEQDLTCHVCWDWLAEALASHGFSEPRVESQEAFFIKHAGEYIARATAADAAHFSTRKMAIMQLLHPANMGQKFQVLHARRGL